MRTAFTLSEAQWARRSSRSPDPSPATKSHASALAFGIRTAHAAWRSAIRRAAGVSPIPGASPPSAVEVALISNGVG